MCSPITRVARIERQGRTLSFPLPVWSLRLAGETGWARYLAWGDPDLRVTRGPWRHVEQMGAAHRLEGMGVELIVVTRKRSRWLTEMDMTLTTDAAAPGL